MKVQVIYLVKVCGVILSAHQSEKLAQQAIERLVTVADLESTPEYSIDILPLSLKGKRVIVDVATFFGIIDPSSYA